LCRAGLCSLWAVDRAEAGPDDRRFRDADRCRGEVYIATDDHDTFQGFIVFYPEEGHILLENVAVLPRAAGRGVGKTLIGFCENAARQRGMNAVHLYTNEKMTDNLSIYPKFGYVEVARRTEHGFNRVYFEKSLI
jgi:GNAT superfamily N-acetyltransferase